MEKRLIWWTTFDYKRFIVTEVALGEPLVSMGASLAEVPTW